MKKILLLFLLFASTLTAVRTYGQAACNGGTGSCNLIPQDVRITIVDTNCTTIPGKVIVTFDINFKIDANDGNKQIYFHSWLASDYPAGIGSSVFACAGNGTENPFTAGGPGNLGTFAQLGAAGTSILDIGLINTASGLVGATQAMPIRPSDGPGGYTPDNTVLLVSPTGPHATAPLMTVTKTLLANGNDSISMRNVVVTVPVACNTPIAVKTLIWAAQSPNGTNAQCWAAHVGQSLNDPALAFVPLCGNPRQYSFSLTTGNTSPTTFNYKVFLHDPLNVAADVEILSGSVIRNVGDAFGGVFNSGTLTIPFPYGNMGPWANWEMRVDVTSPSFSNTITTGNLDVGCNTLPIKLRSFDATRNRSNVDLKWVTEIETNNKGFYVERKLSNGEWQQITFVESKAPNGNSNSPLTYTLTDFNNTKGISQYRLRQMDFDGKQAFSQIRSVRGEGQKSNTIIYPNPSGDGKVSIVFEGANSMRDVSLMDVSGKTLKQWKGVTNNNIQIDNLNSGFYTVRIVNVETGEQVVEKFIVNKR